ncbi:MAG: type III secretion protein S [Cellvibrionaceae bacterium]|jgi:type III secretion protein S
MDTLTLFKKALLLVVVLSATPLIVTIIVGVLTSLFSTLFQIQDQTLPFTLKLVAMTLTLAAAGPGIGGEILNLANAVFEYLPYVGK